MFGFSKSTTDILAQNLQVASQFTHINFGGHNKVTHMSAVLLHALNLTTFRTPYNPLFLTWGGMWKIYSQVRKDTCGKHAASFSSIRVENIYWVTQGPAYKIYSELRKDTCGKYSELRKDTIRQHTVSYARIRVEHKVSYARIRLDSIHWVTQGYVWKI